MKRLKIFFLIIIGLLPLVLVSCYGAGQAMVGWSGTAFDAGVVYAGTRDGRVVAVNSSNRDVLWSYAMIVTSAGGLSCGPTSSATAIYSTPIVDGDLVYVGTYSGQVLALSTRARSQNLTFPQQRFGEWGWDCPSDGAKNKAIVANLLVGEDVIYVSSSNGRVYCLDREFGDPDWQSEVLDKRHEKLWTSPVIRGGVLYVGTLDGHIYALSAETGQLSSWSFQSDGGFASSPVIYEDTLFLGSFDRHLYAVEIGSNASMWRFPAEEPAGNWFWASPALNEDIVYAGCLDGRLYAVNATTGTEIWSYMTEDQEGKPSPIICSPVLMDNSLIVVNESGTVYVFDVTAQNGNEGVPLKTISVGAGVRSSFCADDGLVYVRGENDSVYVVDIGEGIVAEGWPVSLATEK